MLFFVFYGKLKFVVVIGGFIEWIKVKKDMILKVLCVLIE